MVDISLYQYMNEMLDGISTAFHRYMYSEIAWGSRMVGLVGPRGVGKSTLLLQYIKEHRHEANYLYVTADHIYFSNHTLVGLSDEFVMENGQYLFIDEVHKYPNWSRELKNIYDGHPSLRVVFTGSSVLDILQGEADLSRRALMYSMQGLSFREFLELEHGITTPAHTLDEIIHHHIAIDGLAHPLPLFREYLSRGYYPFSHEVGFHQLLQQMVSLTLDVDIPQYADMRVSTAQKFKMLLGIVSQIAPYKPNMTKLAADIGVSKNNIQDYLLYMERAGMIAQLRDNTGGLRALGKVQKVFVDNPTLMYALSENEPNIGNLRETFFFNQMRVRNKVYNSDVSDFCIGSYTFEVGGRKKGTRQIEGMADAYIVKDDIEYPAGNVIPLWAFGLNY